MVDCIPEYNSLGEGLAAAKALRDNGDFASADALLIAAIERFPGDPGPILEHAWVAHIRHDWPEAAKRWQRVREAHGGYAVGYTAGAVALRETGHFDEAEGLLVDAIARFRHDPQPAIEYALVAHARRDWPLAIERWTRVRSRFPQQIVAYKFGAVAAREAGRFDDSDAVLREAMRRFPDELEFVTQFAWIAHARRDWAEAVLRWERARQQVPASIDGYLSGAAALSLMQRFVDAEVVLAKGLELFPGDKNLERAYAENQFQRVVNTVGSMRSSAVTHLDADLLQQLHNFDLAQVRSLLQHQAIETLYLPAPAREAFLDADELYGHVAQRIGASAPVRLLEFGVAGGASISMLAKRFAHPGSRFVGFDSFEGLPEAWRGAAPGTFSTGGRTPLVNDNRISFVKGWIQNTLPQFLLSHGQDWQDGSAVLVHFDADLYSATLFILTLLWYHIPEYFFIMDEFDGDEAIALYEFARAYPAEIEFYALTGTNPHPNRVFGRIKQSIR